jgi:hypothetical protein
MAIGYFIAEKITFVICCEAVPVYLDVSFLEAPSHLVRLGATRRGCDSF